MHIDEQVPDPTEMPSTGVEVGPLEVPDPVLEPDPEPVFCRHCGAMVSGVTEGDWLCPECGRHQDSMVCPTCHQLVRASLMPAELRPEATNPQKRKKGKGE